MRKLFLSTAMAVVLAGGAAMADEVVIYQDYDLDRLPQTVNNAVRAGDDVTESALEGTNLVNVLQWRDVSADTGANGDIYTFIQDFDDKQIVLNDVTSKYGDIGADLEGTNVANLADIEDTIGGTELVGDHILIGQRLIGVDQVVLNTISTDGKTGEILDGSSAAGSNLGNVASITDVGGAEDYGNIIALAQYNGGLTQKVSNVAEAASVGGLEMSGTNGVNIAQFDLASQTGVAEIGVIQLTENVTQTVNNSVTVAGDATKLSLSGTNLGNVVTFADAPEAE